MSALSSPCWARRYGMLLACLGLMQKEKEEKTCLNGFCHADLRPSNILLGLQSLGGLSEEDVFARLGEPETTNICVREDPDLSSEIPYAPKYLVYSAGFDIESILPQAHIIDFGQSFDLSQPAPTSYGIPINYSAPEVVIDNRGSAAMDIWALGCTLFEIRAGERLFNVFQSGNIPPAKDDYVDKLAFLLERTDSIFKKLARCHINCKGMYCDHRDKEKRKKLRFQLISEPEAKIFADLLERLLRWRAEERPSLDEVLEHAWFKTSF
ncbi:hypothetical protein DV735_g5937, partial [Chaetothyriales sp. CBS 134920]